MQYAKAVISCGGGLYCFAARTSARPKQKAACTFSNTRGSRVFYKRIVY